MSTVTCQTDFYKVNHAPMYPEGTTKIYSNLTPRKSRMKGVDGVVVFGIQAFILEYLIKQWNKDFFVFTAEERISMKSEEDKAILLRHKTNVIAKYRRMMDFTLGKDVVDMKHMEQLWDLGYLPLRIKSLPEGTICPIGVPCVTITNTVDHAFWLVNYLETIFSCSVWQPITSATIANEYKKLLTKYAIETTGTTDGVQFQAHDFSMRGMSSLESAKTSGAAHLLSFNGTDCIPAIEFLEDYYGADIEKELVGTSVPATEHSVMCMGMKDGEIYTFERLLDMFNLSSHLSVVSDTWNLWDVCTKILPALKDKILARPGKLVIRPDSGDPVKIITGWKDDEMFYDISDGKYFEKLEDANHPYGYSRGREISKEERKGVITLLWEVFGGTVNEKDYRVLDSHIGAIYGDSITLDRAKEICERLKDKGYASINIVLGIGSYTYQYNTRDTFGFAVKATYGEVNGEGREIFKDPITDDGTKKSKKGLLRVGYDWDDVLSSSKKAELVCIDQQTKKEEELGTLKTVFLNGKMIRVQTLSEIRERLANEG